MPVGTTSSGRVMGVEMYLANFAGGGVHKKGPISFIFGQHYFPELKGRMTWPSFGITY